MEKKKNKKNIWNISEYYEDSWTEDSDSEIDPSDFYNNLTFLAKKSISKKTTRRRIEEYHIERKKLKKKIFKLMRKQRKKRNKIFEKTKKYNHKFEKSLVINNPEVFIAEPDIEDKELALDYFYGLIDKQYFF